MPILIFQLELIKNQGYNAENHEIHTTDGYILSVQRITSGRKEETKKGKKPVVILQHGLEGCSENYIGNLYNQSLGKAIFCLMN